MYSVLLLLSRDNRFDLVPLTLISKSTTACNINGVKSIIYLNSMDF